MARCLLRFYHNKQSSTCCLVPECLNKRFALHLSECYCNNAAFHDTEECHACKTTIRTINAYSTIRLCYFVYFIFKMIIEDSAKQNRRGRNISVFLQGLNV